MISSEACKLDIRTKLAPDVAACSTAVLLRNTACNSAFQICTSGSSNVYQSRSLFKPEVFPFIIKVKKQTEEFSFLVCNEVMTLALTIPCGHNFCKPSLLDSYADKSFVRERVSSRGRTLHAQKIVKKSPTCPIDISDFLQNPQVNRELIELVKTLKCKSEEEEERIKQQLDEEETDMDPVEDTAEASHSVEEMKLTTIQEEIDTKVDEVEAEAMLNADEKKMETIKEEPGNKAQKRGRKMLLFVEY